MKTIEYNSTHKYFAVKHNTTDILYSAATKKELNAIPSFSSNEILKKSEYLERSVAFKGQTYTVKIMTSNKKEIMGFFKTSISESNLILTDSIFGKKSHSFDTKNVINVGAFLASFLANSKISKTFPESTFKSVVVNDERPINVIYQSTIIKKEKLNTLFVFKGHYFNSDTTIQISDSEGKEVSISLDELNVPKFEFPIDWKYTKNDFINELLKKMQAPANVSTDIINAIASNEHRLVSFFENNPDEKFAFINLKTHKILNHIQTHRSRSFGEMENIIYSFENYKNNRKSMYHLAINKEFVM